MEINRTDAIRLINSLKSGVAYEKMADHLMVGREPILNEINRQLESIQSGGSAYKIITGEYGSGKTFLLNYMRKMAVKEGMVVAQLEIDRAFRFYNLEHLYYYIMHNLYIGDSGDQKTSFEDLFERWLSRLQNESNRESVHEEIQNVVEQISKHNATFGRGFLSYIKARISGDHETKNAIEGWLTGEKNIPYTMKKRFDMVGSVNKLNALDFLRAFVKLITLLGYKGFVILVDEFDLVLDDRRDLREKSYYNMKYVIDSVGNAKMDHIMWLFCGTTRLISDQEKGIPSSEALYQRIGEPIVKNRRDFVDYRQPLVNIESIGYEDYKALSEKIVGVYKQAFEVRLTISSEALMNWSLLTLVKEGKIYRNITSRQFVKKLLEILDIIEQNPRNHIFRTELISEIKDGRIQFKTRLGHSILREKAQ